MNRVSTTFAAFAVRDFRLMWGGSLLSVTAFMTSFLLVPSVAYELTGSYAAAGFAAMGSGISQTLLGPLGGVIADRYRKKPMVMAGQVLPGFLIAAMGILILTELISIPLLLLTTLLMGAGFSLMGPARQAWTGEIVPKRLLANAVALQQMSMNAGQVVGPTIVAVAVSAFMIRGADAGYLFLLVASFFVIVLPMTASIRKSAPARPKSEQRAFRVELSEGIRYLRGNRRLRPLWGYFMVMVMCGFAFQTLLPGILDREFGQDPFNIGPTYILFGVASLGINLVLAGVVSGPRVWQALLSMGLIMAVGFWLVALAPSYGALLALGTLIGVGRSGVMLVNQSIMMSNTRQEYFGRVMSLVMMAFGLQSLLAPIWGILADVLGGRETLFLIGVAAAAATALMAVAWLRTRHLPYEEGTAAAAMNRPRGVTPPLPAPAPAAANGNGRMPAPLPAFAAQLAPVVLMEGQKRGMAPTAPVASGGD